MNTLGELGAVRIMRGHSGQGADGGDVPGKDSGGWDLFGLTGLDGLAGLVGDGRDARYVPGVDYTAAVRAAKLGERAVLRSLRQLGWLHARVVTQAWSTEHGEPVVRVEIEIPPQMRMEMEASAQIWHRWVTQVEERERSMRALRDVLRNQRLMTASMRRAWVLCPLGRGWRSEKQERALPRPRDAQVAREREPADG